MTVLSVMFLSAMLIFGGMAVDIMRFETSRARLQATLDRAVLAAADLSVCLDPAQNTQAIVEDYIEKAGFSDELEQVTVVQNANSCAVSATATLELQTIFFDNVGVDTLSTGAGSAATEAMSDAEISLVVDISGSMNGSRINALRPAATDFVNSVFGAFEAGSVTMSLVPYSTQVNVGEDILDAFPGIATDHDNSYCVDLEANAFNSVGFTMNEAYRQTSHFDADSYSYNRSYWGASRFVCNPDPNTEVIAHAHLPGPLTTRISQLQAYEWTSIEIGAKWGVALLDPSTADITDTLVARGAVDGTVSDRPLPYTGNNALKVMVLMTDGANTQSYELDDAYRTGLSDVYIDDSTGLFYVDDEENGNRDGDGSYYEDYYRPNYDNWTNHLPGGARQLTWPELTGLINLDGHAWYFRHEQSGSGHNYNNWYSGIYDTVYSSTKNTRLQAVCDAAKANGIVIFTIGFQVSGNADAVMENCASSPSYYYDVNNLDIDDAFASIATQISALRLIQ